MQYAVKDGKVFVLEANPRSSRTVPFVSKSTGVPLAKIASKVCLGQRLRDVKVRCADGAWRTGAQLMAGDRPRLNHWSVKAPCFPFNKLVGVDTVLGPEMKSTGEVMGIDYDLGLAWAKAMQSAGIRLPTEGTVFFSVRDEDKERILPIASQLADLGLSLVATKGTASYLRDFGVPVQTVWKVYEKGNPDALDLLRRGVIKLLINTASDQFEAPERRDGYMMRRVATELQVPFIANIAAAQAAASAITALKRGKVTTNSLTEYFAARAAGGDVSAKPTIAPPASPR
jgi:carbamoyl-phosphate synthase large subunit